MAEPHASLTPNVLNVGETLSLSFDGWADAERVTVQISEIDNESNVESKGKAKLLITLEGTLEGDVFTPSGTPKLPNAAKDAPKFTLKAGAETFEVPLPDKTREQGMFELSLKVQSTKKQSFQSSEPVLVRAFEHFQLEGEQRPVIAFITGAEKKPGYFEAAAKFWELNADVVVKKKGMSLAEIVELLGAEGEGYGPWGQVNIVAHGRENQIAINLFPKKGDKPDGVHRESFDDFDSNAFPAAESIDSNTQIVFRACNAGQDQELLDAIKTNLFPSAKFVKIPKFVQRYDAKGSVATESFMETLRFDRPTRKLALESEHAGLSQAFAELSGKRSGSTRSPGLAPSADESAELPTFEEPHDADDALGELTQPMLEADTYSNEGKPLKDDEMLAVLRELWVDPSRFHESVATDNTLPERWTLTPPRKQLNPKPARDPGVIFEIKAGKGPRRFTQFEQGRIGVGSSPGEGVEVIADGTEPLHAIVEFAPTNPNQVVVHSGGTGTVSLKGSNGASQTLASGDSTEAKLPITLTLGKAVVAVRRGRLMDVNYSGTRFFVDRRRYMRSFDASKPYAERPLVIPSLDNPLHYGTAE